MVVKIIYTITLYAWMMSLQSVAIYTFCLLHYRLDFDLSHVSVYGDLVPHWQSKRNSIKEKK